MLQRDEPQNHRIRKILLEQLRSVLVKFIEPDVIFDAADLTKLDIAKKENHKTKEEIVIGHECKTFIAQNEGKLDLQQFYKDVKEFYIASSQYMIDKYPFGEDLLIHAQVLDISNRTKVQFSSVEYVQQFNFITEDQMDELEQQFLEYQVDSDIVDKPECRIDTQGSEIGLLQDVTNSTRKYQLLASVMEMVLTVFHSNADCERVFSVVGKTRQRNEPV